MAADMDTSIRRIVIQEEEDLDLDRLLVSDGAAPEGSQLRRASCEANAAHSPLPALVAAATAAQCPAAGPSSPSIPILAQEEEEEDGEAAQDAAADGEWVLPAPARPGDFLTNSLHKVPSRGILKKTSSYGNFDASLSSTSGKGGLGRKAASCLNFRGMDASSSSQCSLTNSGSRRRVANGSPLDSSLSRGASRRTKQSSYLSMASSTSGSQVGWDLDASNTPSPSVFRPPGSIVALDAGDLPAVPKFGADADRAAGMDSSGSAHSGRSSGRMRRNVSFHSVDVREYDRTVGDNPSCRSGPPLSLDWSYSKKYQKNLEEYEADRATERVPHLRKLHVNKYKRRSLLAYHWGHTDEEMKAARKDTKRAQRERTVTQMLLPLHMAEEAFIGFKRFLSRKDGADELDLSISSKTKDSSSNRHTVATERTSSLILGRGTEDELSSSRQTA